jgi:type II secretion system GspH-like protein
LPLLLPARGRLRGSGLRLPASGMTLVEALAILAIAATAVAIVAPGVGQLRASVAVRSAAGEVAAAFAAARVYAIRRGVQVGVKYRKNGDRYEWTLYSDGNGNGIRTAEITRGIDRAIGIAYPWQRDDVRPGILSDCPVPDPSNPSRPLERSSDPIRFNSSDICSFSPVGESTPGSVYLWDGHDRMAVVRVYGRSAKIHTLFYRRGEAAWKP